jgi:hypothetical protein
MIEKIKSLSRRIVGKSVDYRTYNADSNLIKRYRQSYEEVIKMADPRDIAVSLVELRAYGLENKIFGAIAIDLRAFRKANKQLDSAFKVFLREREENLKNYCQDIKDALLQYRHRETMVKVAAMFISNNPHLKKRMLKAITGKEKKSITLWT